MLFLAFSCTKPDNGANTGNTDGPETSLTVGGYYSSGLVQGIVFSLDEDGEHGLVVTPDAADPQW